MGNPRKRILFVDDDLVDRMAFTRMVAEKGLPYDYTVAGAISEAKNLISPDTYDVAILDYYLGDGTAFELFGLLEGVPILIITGTGSEEIAVKAIKAGAYDYLIKDIDRNYLQVLPVTVDNAIEHKQAIDRLFWLASIAESSTDAVIGLYTDGNIKSWNKGAGKMFGYASEEVLDKPFTFLVAEDQLEGFNSNLERIRDGETIPNHDTKGVTKDGKTVDISLTLSPIKSSTGRLFGVSAIARDISERKKLDMEKSKFYTMVTHDLKSPLTAILGYAELLMDNSLHPGLENAGEMVEQIYNSGNRLLNMVDDFLTMSKLESGRLEMHFKEVDVKKFIAEVSRDYAHRASRKGVLFEADVPDGLPPLLTDRRYLERVLSNLMENAVNYTPEGGRVGVKVEVISGGSGSCMSITVYDTGTGIPESELERVFEMYYRSTDAGVTKGSGLGLAIVKSVTEAMNGHVRLKSVTGSGSAFTVVLPVSHTDSCAMSAPGSAYRIG
jgi:two-component system sensor histidine kinase VicK